MEANRKAIRAEIKMEVYLTEDDEYDLETVVRTHLGGGLYFDVEDAEVVDEH